MAASTTYKSREAKARRECHKLNALVGCRIDTERMGRPGDPDQYTNYWVYGPSAVYDLRADPCEGNHCHASWQECLFALKLYARDLHFHLLWIDGIATKAIIDVCETDARGTALLLEWWDGPPDDSRYDVGMILADWLTDNGREDLADVIRAAVTTTK